MKRLILPAVAALALSLGGVGSAQPPVAAAPVSTPPAAPADEALSPAETLEDLNAAVVPPPANSDADAPADIRAHEERAAEALDPNSPSALADYAPTGPGCGQTGAGLSCGTNREVRDRPAARPQTPERDLVGRPR